MTTTRYTLTCLSPVHVGTGNQLSKFDGAYQDRQWFVIDLDAVLAHPGVDADALARAMGERNFAWASWLQQNGLAAADAAAYALPCPQDPDTVAVRDAIKTYLRQPYLPGTSVKGALRTAVLTRLLTDARNAGTPEWRKVQYQLEELRGNPRWLGQPIERAVLGRNPNHDLMRAVQVVDSQPVAVERLAVGLVWTYTLRGNRLVEKRESDGDYKSFVEWFPSGTALRLDVRLDDFLFGDMANRELRFRDAREQSVRQLARTCNAHAQALVASEKEFLAACGPTVLHEFYQELEAALPALPEGAFLLNVGWGGGWEVKTLGDLLRTALGREGFQKLRQQHRLGRRPDAPFPKTRRLAYEGGAAQWPMGWVKLIPDTDTREAS